MKPWMLFFGIGILAANVLLVRYSWKVAGRWTTIILFTFLFLVGVQREAMLGFLAAQIRGVRPYEFAGQGLAPILGAPGWVFTNFLAFAWAKMIRRRTFPGTNLYWTLLLAGLVTTTISYAVEATGTRAGFWIWEQDSRVGQPWLPFDWPAPALDGWVREPVNMLAFCIVRYKLFSRRTRVNVAMCVPFIVAASIYSTVFYVTAGIILGFAIPHRAGGMARRTAVGGPADDDGGRWSWTRQWLAASAVVFPERATRYNVVGTLRRQWHVIVAGMVMVGVLIALDIGLIGNPALILACTPFLIVMVATLIPMQPVHLLGWMAACAGVAWLQGDARFTGLAYPAVVLAFLMVLHRIIPLLTRSPQAHSGVVRHSG
jgi:hypothetical protein